MSRRIIAGLLAGAGLGILVVGIAIMVWAGLADQHRPLRVAADDEALEALLESAPYIRLSAGDRPVTIIAPRDAPELERWVSDDVARLRERGREVRLVLVPSGHGGAAEEATVVELWARRDITLLREWFSMRAEHWTAIGVPSAASSSERMAILAEAKAFGRAVMRAISGREDDNRWPVIVWRDGANQLAACRCNTAAASDAARYALRIDGSDEDELVVGFAEDEALPPSEYDDADEDDGTADYPDLPVPDDLGRNTLTDDWGEDSETVAPLSPSPYLPGDVTPEPAPRSAPAQTVPQRPRTEPRPRPSAPPRVVNREPPKAEKDAESLFY